MTAKLKERLGHAMLAMMLSAGLVMPVCGSMDSSLLSPRLLIVIAGVILLFEAASLHRAAALSAALLAAGGAAVWAIGGNGTHVITDAVLAVGLRLRGIKTAVPLAAGSVSLLTAVIMTLLCCFATMNKTACIPAMLLCTAVMMAVWVTDSIEMLPWLLPALAAVLTLLMTYRFEGTSVLRVFPWTAALTAAAFLLAGTAPAENPVRERADEIRQQILDRLFFTEARDVFSLYSVGYSPQGSSQLGGKPNPSKYPVMQVSTAKTVYLRGTVYNRYDGHGWQNTTGGRRYLWQSARMAETRAGLFDETLPPDYIQNSLSEPVTVSVRMLSESASTLFVPQRVRELMPGGEMVPYFSNSSEIFITRNLEAGDTYEVSAPLYSADDPGIGPLTEICASLDDPGWETVRNTYLELPSHLEKRVTDLALDIASGAATPYEKARALQTYLIRRCKYTLDVGEHPENIDFVTAFLLDTKKGYCTYFASAMTVMCRIAGLPARYVEGYLAQPDENGGALLTGMDAHAWTEVYFKGFGWLTFDATPGRHSSGQQGGSNPTAAPLPAEEPTLTPEPEQTPDPEGGEEAPVQTSPENSSPAETPTGIPPETDAPQEPPGSTEGPAGSSAVRAPSLSWWILAVVTAAAAVGIRLLVTSPSFREKRAKTEQERYDIWAEEIPKLLWAEQFERRTGETPISFARRVDRSCRFSESISPAGECLSLIRYSAAKPVEADTGLMRDTSLLIRGEMTRPGKIRYLFRRLLPGKHAPKGKGRKAG